jgi:hypothetical protein
MSVRLTREESTLMQTLARREAVSPAAMLKWVVREGLRTKLLESALAAYSEGRVSIGEAAEMAHLPSLTFFDELRRRRLTVLDESANLPGELADLAAQFGTERLGQVAREL